MADICAICEEPLDDDRVTDDSGSFVHTNCLRLVLGYTESERLFECPHCGHDTPHPRGTLWGKLIASRMTCQHCGKDFVASEQLYISTMAMFTTI